MKINKSIAIHHHALIYKSESYYYINSFIGAWINEICKYYKSVSYIAHCSQKKSIEQDFKIKSSDINFISLGPELRFRNFNKKKIIIDHLLKANDIKYDLLLVRGITPYQNLVIRNFKAKKMFYLLVGNLRGGDNSFNFKMSFLLQIIFYFLRIYKMRIFSDKVEFLVNSPGLIKEIKQVTTKKPKFVPTNTLKNDDFNSYLNYDIIFSEKISLIFVGRVVEDKGIYELIKAFIHLNKSKKNKYFLNIIGSCTKKMKRKILDLIPKQIESRIKFHGFIKFGPNLFELYKQNNFFILPSYHEGFPHTIWEAASQKISVITTKVGGIPDLVNENEVTFIKKKNVKSLIEKILYLQNNPRITNKKIEALYNKSLKYSLENCVKILSNTVN